MLLNHTKNIELWLVLLYLPNLSLKRKHDLLSLFGSPKLAFDALLQPSAKLRIRNTTKDALRSWQQSGENSVIGQQITTTLAWESRPNNHLITLDDERYPERLSSIAQPPLLLFVKGNPDILSLPQIAIVGSRQASPVGRDTARMFAQHLAAAGIITTSGLARGIDGYAHQGALDKSAATIAIMATGADIIYPRQHKNLAKQILAKGALVSEFPLGTSPLPALFPQRNRIISGLSLGVLVVEAALRSGSLISARFALEQGREVFAVPGSIHNHLSNGCHDLIRNGAKLVATVDDILEELTGVFTPSVKNTISTTKNIKAIPVSLQGLELRIFKCIGYDTTTMDYLVEQSQLPITTLNVILMQLELKSLICSVPGGFVRSISSKIN